MKDLIDQLRHLKVDRDVVASELVGDAIAEIAGLREDRRVRFAFADLSTIPPSFDWSVETIARRCAAIADALIAELDRAEGGEK